MAQAKYSRVDGRKSSSYCSTVSIVVFVAFCLVGIWTLMSTIVPVQNSDLTSEESANEVKQMATENGSGQFDSSGGLAEDSTNGDGNTGNEQNIVEQESENRAEENQEEVVVKDNFDENTKFEKDSENAVERNQKEQNVKVSSDEKSEAEEEPKTQVENDGDGKTGDGDSNSGDGGTEAVVHEVVDSEQQTELEEKLSDDNKSELADGEKKLETKESDQTEIFPAGAQSELLNETTTQNGAWSTQAMESQNEKESTTQLTSLQVEATMNIERGTVLMKLPHVLFLYLKDINARFGGLKAGKRYGIHNVPHTKLAEVKGHQNWVKVTGEYLTFPGGGTQFINGALHYIDFIQQIKMLLPWSKDVLAMSFAPKDEHEAQVQFALERGIPAISSVMGTKRLPFPGAVFDVVHCARCRVPWHIEGGKLLLELNRVLRPGAMSELTKSMCWDLVTVGKDKLNGVGAAIFRKPATNECYDKRPQNEPPLCKDSDDPNAACSGGTGARIGLKGRFTNGVFGYLLDIKSACLHKVPVDESQRGSQWPEQWPLRLEKPPYWLSSQAGVYRKGALEDFNADYKHWKNVVSHSYLNGMGIDWFAAALKGLKVWVMNVVPIDSPDTLPIIYERGLFGIYHDWCESFNTYPRSYDLLHADHLFSSLKKRCKLMAVVAEVDRILTPEGKLIVRDNVETKREVENMAKSLQWEIRLIYSNGNEGLLCVQKTFWRPTEMETIMSAIS
uniref:Methyltransferase n=1 Tax=Fagus sylvatica TaxID=28930 RepID=A0A2N9EKU4_FAGSY